MYHKKEAEVVTYIAHGYTNQEIADALYRTRHAVRWHVNTALKKARCRTREQLIFLYWTKQLHESAYSWKLIPKDEDVHIFFDTLKKPLPTKLPGGNREPRTSPLCNL